MTVLTPMVLGAATPDEWLDRHLVERYEHDGHGHDAEPGAPERWFTRADLLAGDAAILRAAFDRLVQDDLPPPAAATFVAFYVGGVLADAVGFCLAGTGAGLRIDGDRVRWRQHPDGWVDRIDLAGTRFLVPADHPWSGRSDVDVVDDGERRIEETVGSLVDAVAPIIDVCHGLARIGRAGLWNEVGDGLGLALVYQHAIAADAELAALLQAAVRARTATWKARPTLRIAPASFGPTFVGQKGGCCLAYTRERPPVAEAVAPPEDESDEDRAYRERFPELPGAPQYCSTCSLRDPADCEARQIFWLERERATSTTNADVVTSDPRDTRPNAGAAPDDEGER